MAQSKCVKCESTRFEMKDSPAMGGTDFVWLFVQCAECGGVVGVVDFHRNAGILERLERIKQHLEIP